MTLVAYICTENPRHRWTRYGREPLPMSRPCRFCGARAERA